VHERRYKEAEVLVELGAPVHLLGLQHSGLSPLHRAVQMGDVTMLKLLLRKR
jgi:hypothetical protein